MFQKLRIIILGQQCSCPLHWGPDCALHTGHSKIMFGGDVIEHRPTHMKNMLQFYFRDNFMNDGSKLNECVRKITGGKAAHPWAGPILVLKAKRCVFRVGGFLLN